MSKDIEYKIASDKEIDIFMDIRLEMLRNANGLPDNYTFSDECVY